MINKIDKAKNYLQSKIPFQPQIGIILGTGLSGLAEIVENPIVIPFEEIPEFVVSTAPGHSGKLIAGDLGGKKVIMMQGRFHFYEGYKMEEVTFPIRVMQKMGVEYLFVTNASGSLNAELTPGTLVLIEDHINFLGTNPLIGKNMDEFGERFPSMHEAYNLELRKLALAIAEEQQINLKRGVYLAISGPSLETKAECKMLASWGADLVGMSTVPEVIVAVHSGIKVLGVSVVTNLSNIFHDNPHSQEEIRENADKAKKQLETLFINVIKRV